MVRESKSKDPENETDVYVHSIVQDVLEGNLVSSTESAKTLYEGLKTVVGGYKKNKFLGRIKENEEIEYITFGETRKYAKRIAAFLCQYIEKNDIPIGICSENRPEWIIAEHATYFFDGINCPIYPSFGWSAMKHIMQETKMRILFVSEKNLEKLTHGIEKESGEMVWFPEIFIVMDNEITEHAKSVLEKEGIKVEYFWNICKVSMSSTANKESIEKMQKKNAKAIVKFKPPKPESIATICYTSGTTGAPKGAMLTHKNFMSISGSFIILSKAGNLFKIGPGTRYLSFLPLAHVFERIVETTLLMSRCTVIYYRGIPKQIQKDFIISQSNYFIGVPRVFNSIKAAIEMKAAEKGPLAKALFQSTVFICKYLKNKYVREAFGRSMFKKVRESFGGSIMCMLSGSAPLLSETAEFFEIVFNCQMYEGYGQTETAAGNIATHNDIREKNVIGLPFPCNRVKLVSRPESNAYVRNMQGELLIQGPSVFLGYYKQDKLTEEVFEGANREYSLLNKDENKWIRTGDIAEITKEGNLKIIGRCKEIFKLSQGEYIIPEKIENQYLKKKIQNLQDIMITGDSSKDYVVAICVVKELSEAQKEAMKEEIRYEGDKLVASNELIKIELPKKIIFTETEFTIDNGLLTPSGKKVRKKIVEYFQKEINSAYKK